MKTSEILLEQIIPKEVAYNSDKVIFLENSSSLYSESSISNFREFLIENKIRHNCYYNLDQLTDKQLIDLAKHCLDSVVVFETTGLSSSFKRLLEIFIFLCKNGYRYKFIECRINRATIHSLPEGVDVEFYHLDAFSEDIDNWKIEKIN